MGHAYRTKATIEEGLTVLGSFTGLDREGAGGSPARAGGGGAASGAYKYSPGNGTVYRFTLADVPSAARVALGCGTSGAWVVFADLGAGRCCILQGGEAAGLLHPSYLKEKLHCGEADAVVLAEVVGHLLGRPVVDAANYGEG